MKRPTPRTSGKTVLARASGQVYTHPDKVRIWGDASYHYRNQAALRTPPPSEWMSLDLFDQRVASRQAQAQQKYATVPAERALVVRAEWEFFKGSGLPDTWL